MRASVLSSIALLASCAEPFELPCDAAPDVVELGSADATFRVELELRRGGSRYPASFAVWRIDSDDRAHSLYATCKAAHDQWDGGGHRPQALPVWSAVREAELADDAFELDAISSATPVERLDIVSDDVAGELEIRIEANVSFDTNDAYPSSPNGQPSMVWAAHLDADESGPIDATLVGHGAVDGGDASIHADSTGVTTAREIVARATVSRSSSGR